MTPEHTTKLFAVAKASELNTSMTFQQVGLRTPTEWYPLHVYMVLRYGYVHPVHV